MTDITAEAKPVILTSAAETFKRQRKLTTIGKNWSKFLKYVKTKDLATWMAFRDSIPLGYTGITASYAQMAVFVFDERLRRDIRREELDRIISGCLKERCGFAARVYVVANDGQDFAPKQLLRYLAPDNEIFNK